MFLTKKRTINATTILKREILRSLMIKKIINLTTNLKREVIGILMKKKTIKVTMITIIEGEEEKEEEEEVIVILMKKMTFNVTMITINQEGEKEEEEDKEGQMNLNYQMIILYRTYQKNLKTIIALKTSN